MSVLPAEGRRARLVRGSIGTFRRSIGHFGVSFSWSLRRSSSSLAARGDDLVIGVGFFLVWDAAGIGLGIFFRGDPSLLVGVQLAPELPLEELFFLTLLCYLTRNTYGALTRWSSSRRSRRIETGAGA